MNNHDSTQQTIIDAVMVGKAQVFGPNGEMSATRKTAASGPVELRVLGLAGDEHTDPNHGGSEKALLHYAGEHYRLWARLEPGFVLQPGGFGENITSLGMTEADVCVGDRYRIGDSVVVEVSQPRQPCWKLSYNAGSTTLAELMQVHAAPGWYYRVIEPGVLTAGMPLLRIARPLPDWDLARLIRGFYGDPLNTEFLQAVVALELLGPEWRKAAARRLETGSVERWHGRLYGPIAGAPAAD